MNFSSNHVLVKLRLENPLQSEKVEVTVEDKRNATLIVLDTFFITLRSLISLQTEFLSMRDGSGLFLLNVKHHLPNSSLFLHCPICTTDEALRAV